MGELAAPRAVTGAGVVEAGSRAWRRPLVWLGVLVALALVALALRTIDLREVWRALRGADLRWLAPALALLAAATVLRALRWRGLFVSAARPPLAPVTASLLLGQFFNQVLPLRAGEAVRLLDLHRRTGRSRAEVGATIAVERLFDVLGLLALLFVALPWLPDAGWIRTAGLLAAALLALTAVAAAVLLAFGERALRLLVLPFRLVPVLDAERLSRAPGNLLQGFAGLRQPRIAAAGLVWTVLSWLLFALSAWVLMLAFDLDVPVHAGLFVMVAVGLAMIVPAPPASLGVFEAATVVALTAYGVDAAPALSYALVLHALNLVPYVVAGLVVLAASSRVSA